MEGEVSRRGPTRGGDLHVPPSHSGARPDHQNIFLAATNHQARQGKAGPEASTRAEGRIPREAVRGGGAAGEGASSTAESHRARAGAAAARPQSACARAAAEAGGRGSSPREEAPGLSAPARRKASEAGGGGNPAAQAVRTTGAAVSRRDDTRSFHDGLDPRRRGSRRSGQRVLPDPPISVREQTSGESKQSSMPVGKSCKLKASSLKGTGKPTSTLERRESSRCGKQSLNRVFGEYRY